jgi:probable aminopeptidase NPEPL1
VCPKKVKAEEKTAAASKASHGASVSWLNRFVIHTLSGKCSRDNTPSRAHLITKHIRNNPFGENQLILVACERRNAVACANAVARAFSLYSKKTGGKSGDKQRNVNVAFLFVDSNLTQLHATSDEVTCFNVLAKSVRLTAKIVETPCADMTTDHFLEVFSNFSFLIKLLKVNRFNLTFPQKIISIFQRKTPGGNFQNFK